MSDQERAAIEQGLADIAAGKTTPWHEVKAGLNAMNDQQALDRIAAIEFPC